MALTDDDLKKIGQLLDISKHKLVLDLTRIQDKLRLLTERIDQGFNHEAREREMEADIKLIRHRLEKLEAEAKQ